MEEKTASADSLPTLWLVVPCYNEEDVLPITALMFKETVAGLMGEGLVGPREQDPVRQRRIER